MRLVSNFFRNIYPNCCNQHSVDEKWLGILARPETKRAWSYSSFISFSKASFQSMILFLRVIRCYLLMKSLSSRMWSPEESYEAMGDWSNAGHLSTWPRGTLHRFVVPLLYVRGNAVWSAFVEPRVITVVCHDRCTTTDWIVSDRANKFLRPVDMNHSTNRTRRRELRRQLTNIDLFYVWTILFK
jgi:hypothetical protein